MHRISTPETGRKSPHFLQPGSACAGPQADSPQARTPRPRAFIADGVRRDRAISGVFHSGQVLDHISDIPTRIPKGTRAAPLRGGATIRAAAESLDRAVRRGWGTHEGTAVGLLDALRRAGHLLLMTTPAKLAAGAAMAMLSRLTPLVEQVGHGRYRIHACRPDCLPQAVLNLLLCGQQDDARLAGPAAQMPVDDQQIDAPIQDDAPVNPADSADPLSAPMVAPLYTRAQGDTQEGPSSASDGEQLWLEPDYPGAAAGSIFDPAEEAQASTATPPARPKIKPLVPWTRSGWVQAVPPGRHVQRAAILALEHLVGGGRRGTAATVAAGLAGYEGRTSARHRAALARALETLRRRGLLVVTEDRWQVPVFVKDPVLELLDVIDVGDNRPVSPALADYLRRMGIDPAGMGHDEALAVSRRLYTRREEGKAPPRLLAAVAREQALADLPPDLRKLRRLDLAEARRELRRAMEVARAAVDPWSAGAYDGGHG